MVRLPAQRTLGNMICYFVEHFGFVFQPRPASAIGDGARNDE